MKMKKMKFMRMSRLCKFICPLAAPLKLTAAVLFDFSSLGISAFLRVTRRRSMTFPSLLLSQTGVGRYGQ